MNKSTEIECPLPKELLPDCWFDKDRMNALYAPFRSSNVNSEDRNSKTKFWKKFITNYCIHKNICTYSLTELKQCLKRDGRPPACLPDIIEDMYNNSEIQTLDKFMATPIETWSGWAVNVFVKYPIVWSYNKVKERVVAATDEHTVFVDLNAVKTIAEKIFRTIQGKNINKVVDFEYLFKVVQDKHEIDEENFKHVLHHLRCQGKVAVKEHSIEHNVDKTDKVVLIKIAQQQEKVLPINEIELSFYSLEKHEAALSEHVEELEAEKEKLIMEAKAYLAKGMRSMAKSCLRKKQALEKCIEKRSGVLENVQLLLSQIIEAEYNTKVVDSFKKGVKAFKSTLGEAGVDENNVSDVISDVQEMLDINQDIQSSLGQNIAVDYSDNAELEEELAALLLEPSEPDGNFEELKKNLPEVADHESEFEFDEKHKELERRLQALHMPPSPPTHSPTPSKDGYSAY